MNEGARWGVLAPTFDPFGAGTPPLVEAAKTAESLGFDSVWVGDHLLSPPPVLDSLCALAAIASVTSHVELGISVLQLGLRHLVWTAKQLATIDALAPGRLRLGVGVGGEFPEEFAAAGVELSSRGARLDEMLEILPALMRGEAVHRVGRYVSVAVAGLRPSVAALPRLGVGGRSEAALRRAVRYGDHWITIWHDPDTVRDRAEVLAKLADEADRPVPTVSLLVLVNVNRDIDSACRETDTALQGQYRMPLSVVERWTLYGGEEDVARKLLDYRSAGVDEFLLLPASADPLGQYSRLRRVRELVEG